MDQIKKSLENGGRTRQWVRIDKYHMNLYFRITERFLGDFVIPTIDVASVEVDREYQTQGLFTSFITELEQLAQEYSRAIYVETIVRTFLLDSLIKRGYSIMTPDFRSVAKIFA